MGILDCVGFSKNLNPDIVNLGRIGDRYGFVCLWVVFQGLFWFGVIL